MAEAVTEYSKEISEPLLAHYADMVTVATELKLPDGTTRNVDIICATEGELVSPLFVIVDERWLDLISNPFPEPDKDQTPHQDAQDQRSLDETDPESHPT